MTDTKLVTTAGEHWTCAMLARLGWAPALTRDGLARTDILAVSTLLPGRPAVEVQVKTATYRRRDPTWPLPGVTRKTAQSEHEWFVFVAFPEALAVPPRAFVVPRDHVCAGTWLQHQGWLTDPSARPGQRNAGLDQARIRSDVWEGYEDRWDDLGTPTSGVQVRLPPRLRDLAQDERVGLPAGHPWNEELPPW